MIFLHIVLGVMLLMLIDGFIKGASNDNVSPEAMLGMVYGLTFLTLLAFGVSFLK